jgi:hypothetical protein
LSGKIARQSEGNLPAWGWLHTVGKLYKFVNKMYLKLFITGLLLLLLIQLSEAQNWIQPADAIYGSDTSGNIGHSVAMNSEGTIVAVNSGGNFSPSKIFVYKLTDNQWMRLGNAIICGSLVSKISGDGTTLISGFATDHDSLGNWCGSVTVFKWDGSSWLQRGNKIYGEDNFGGYFGYSVGISYDGNSILVYAPYDENRVRAYQWNVDSAAWEQKGSTVSLGYSTSSITGGSIGFSSDGNTFITGNPYTDTGKVGVFSWDGSDWVQKGTTFTGIAGEHLGTNVNINSNGNTVLMSSPLNDNNGSNTGELKLYEWDGASWNQKGQAFNGAIISDIDCCSANLASGMDSLGNTFAFWIEVNDNPFEGVVRIYSWNDSVWTQKGLDLIGGGGDNVAVDFISLNSTGNVLAIGFPYDFTFEDGYDNGRVKVYKWLSGLSTDDLNTTSAFKMFANPSKDKVVFTQEVKSVAIFNITCQLIQNSTPTGGREMNISVLKSGTYILKIVTEKEIFREILIKE